MKVSIEVLTQCLEINSIGKLIKLFFSFMTLMFNLFIDILKVNLAFLPVPSVPC